jgi:hypothetical protein
MRRVMMVFDVRFWILWRFDACDGNQHRGRRYGTRWDIQERCKIA